MTITPEQLQKIQQLKQQSGFTAPTSQSGVSAFDRIDARLAIRGKTQAKNFQFDIPKTSESEAIRKANIASSAVQAQKEAEQANSPLGFIKNFAKGAIEALAPSETELGKTIAKSFGNQSEVYAEQISKLTDSNIQLFKRIKEKEKAGENADQLKRTYNSNVTQLQELRGGVKEETTLPTNLQVAGQIGGTALDIATAGTYGKATQGLKTGTLGKARLALLGKGEAVPFFSKQTAKEVGTGAAGGYAFDVSHNLQEGETGLDVAKPGLGTTIGAGIPLVGRGLPALKKTLTPTPKEERLQNAVNSLEDTYQDIALGRSQSRKVSEKAARVTQYKNKAGTVGRTPERVLAESGIVPDYEGTTFTTNAQADKLLEQTKPLHEVSRRALKEVSYSTEPIATQSLEAKAIAKARSAENIASGDASTLVQKIKKEFAKYRSDYGDNINILDLDEIKSARWKKKGFSLTKADKLSGDVDYMIAKVAQETIEETAAKAGHMDVAQLNRDIGDILEATKTLRNLDGKKVLYGRMGKYMTRLGGTIIGASTGGVPGGLAGMAGGEMMARMLTSNSIASPTKRMILKQLERTNPKAYTDTLLWLQKQGLDRELRLLLNPASEGAIINQGRPIISGAFKEGEYIGTDLVAPQSSKGQIGPISQLERESIKYAPQTRNIPPSSSTIDEKLNYDNILPQVKEKVKDFVENPKLGLSLDDISLKPAQRFKEEVVAQLDFKGKKEIAQKLNTLDVTKIKTHDDLVQEVTKLVGKDAVGTVDNADDIANHLATAKNFFQKGVEKVKGLHPEDAQALTDYIDAVRVGKDMPESQWIGAERILERTGANMDKSTSELAKYAEDLLAGVKPASALYKTGAPFKGEVSSSLDKVFNELKAIPKGNRIENPFALISTPFILSKNIEEIIGATGVISFTKKSLKHLAEKKEEGDRLMKLIPDILKNPDEIRQGDIDNRFLISKSIKDTKGGRPHVVNLEVIKKDGNIIVTSFQSDMKYLDNFDLLWRTGASKDAVSPSSLSQKGLSPAPDFSGRKGDQKYQ